MTERDTKTVGIKRDVHRELKLLCAANGWSMSEAIAHMMKLLKDDNSDGKDDRKTD